MGPRIVFFLLACRADVKIAVGHIYCAGPPYLLEKNRDFYKEACKMNPSFGIIHDHLKAKTNPNYTGPRQKKGPERGAGFTATHYSALYANATMLAMLLRARAELNIQAKCGRTPLLIACAGTYPDHEKVARMLVRGIYVPPSPSETLTLFSAAAAHNSCGTEPTRTSATRAETRRSPSPLGGATSG